VQAYISYLVHRRHTSRTVSVIHCTLPHRYTDEHDLNLLVFPVEFNLFDIFISSVHAFNNEVFLHYANDYSYYHLIVLHYF